MASEQFTTIVELLTAARQTPANTVDELREGVAGLTLLIPVPDGTTTADIDAAGVGARWVATGTPADADDGVAPVVLHFHGGGYVMASPDTHVPLCSALAAATGGRVLSVDYRLAPEDPFPAAADDALAAYSWLVDRVDPTRVVLAGDSAGGGLALGLLARARDLGLPLPAGAALLSPWVDLTSSGESVLGNAGIDPILGPTLTQHWATLYAGDQLADPLASPLFGDLTGLPPALVQVGRARSSTTTPWAPSRAWWPRAATPPWRCGTR